MDKEAGVNALIGMGVAIQLMAMGAVLLFLRFIWRKFLVKLLAINLMGMKEVLL